MKETNEQTNKVFLSLQDIRQITKVSLNSVNKYLKFFDVPYIQIGTKRIYKYVDCIDVIQLLLDMKKK